MRTAAVVLAAFMLAALVDVAVSAEAYGAPPAVYQWGFNSGKSHVSPSLVRGLPTGIVAVQGGNWGGMAIDSFGNVWDWGRNQFGELGNGRHKNSPNIAVRAIGPTNVVSIGEGDDFAAAVDKTGNLWVWGWNAQHQLCLSGVRNTALPMEITGLGAAAVSGGGSHLLILLANGTVDACGLNSSGQLGNGTFHNSSSPVPVKGLTNVVSVSAGNMFSGAMEADGSVWTWGYDKWGQLGLGSTVNRDTPQRVNLPSPATQLYVGGDYPNDGHVVALLSDGKVMSWGNNAEAQLGVATVGGMSTTPVQVDVPIGVTFSYVAAGGADSFAIDSTGGLWAWGGRPGAGDLGDGTKDGWISLPEKVGSGFTLVSATANEAVGYSTGP
jgi:alpha-tubulin suppressor-like RCC1 family protein